MQFEKGDWFGISCVLLGIFLLGMLGGTLIMVGKYREGQIDALTGNAYYELIEHEDNTRTWERIDG